ncbi:AraC family transcriptional regulator [Sulfitobacter sp.]|jgi:AraC family transcriptional activator of pobA|uniref:AraC family transcriptional regulator n=1 Tax=Sulfitobacter sp. TaxID=1903071 RepID=UPI002729C074|nr:AraC family transcriptional regulator [Sulfitobacter sp.]
MTENTIELLTLAQLSQGQDWRVQLCHDRPVHMLIWITRGQGLLQLDGQRRGLGAHNAVFIPARALFALDMGRQGIGQAVVIPDGTELRLPQMPRHLRIRDVQAQTELTGLIEAAQREQQAKRPLYHDALEGHAALMSVWLRRQITQDEHVPNRRNAAARLSARFCQMVCEHYSSGAPMAQYAESLDVTPTHLSRAVKSATGKTAADILTERVVHEARHLLGTTEHSAQDIARHLGFGSAAYFTRFMQQHTGLTPSRLRATAA